MQKLYSCNTTTNFFHNLTILSVLDVITDSADRHSPAADSMSAAAVLAADTQDTEPEAQGNSLEREAVELEAAVDRPRVEREVVEGMATSARCTTDRKAAQAKQACSGIDFLKSIHCRLAGEARRGMMQMRSVFLSIQNC
jgi:hypothetical protein